MIDLRNLRNLAVLARRLNYVRAAEELGITQPTLTRSIQALERQLEVRLFDRNRGGVSLTPQGRVIAERASLLLMEAEDLMRHSALTSRGESGRIRFGMAPMPARALLPPVLCERLKQAPSVANEVVVRDVEALWEMLLAGDIEFFVSPNRPLHDLSPARIELLGEFPLSLIVRAGHPLTQGNTGRAKFPLVRSSWTGMFVPGEMLDPIFDTPNIVEDFATLADLTAGSDAIWLSSAYVIAAEIDAGTFVELYRAQQRIEVDMYTLKRRSRSPLTSLMAKAFKDHVQYLENRGARSRALSPKDGRRRPRPAKKALASKA